MDFKNIVRLKDTINVPVVECNEPMVALDPELFIIDIRKTDMVESTGDQIFVRQGIAQRLIAVQEALQKDFPGRKLLFTYGYRTPEVQKGYFEDRLLEVKDRHPEMAQDEQAELAHSMSAHPDSAGHVCGAAVDVTIWDDEGNSEVDMGSQIAEFGDVAYTNYPGVTDEQKENRLYLNKIMTEQGFAPFLGEWWHFSYGDKEWAFFYKHNNAIYGPVNPEQI